MCTRRMQLVSLLYAFNVLSDQKRFTSECFLGTRVRWQNCQQTSSDPHVCRVHADMDTMNLSMWASSVGLCHDPHAKLHQSTLNAVRVKTATIP